ncbi:MAG: D-alanyl-D-alanine carboxypeptidase/D-alanyl-D-alanine-endopeptidase [Phycisphaeraceae bacterium]|nr:MAG: D-alanyl-D-alanine carboxypeptidase/D-alanyl-D-alanine-endopeptidase [Phycisphaeraceae bacterium]
MTNTLARRRGRVGSLRAWVGFAVAGLSGWCAPALAQPLNTEIERLLSRSKLGTEQAGVVVTMLGDTPGEDRLVASVGGDRRFIPASNQKVITSGAALLVLGAEYSFRTEVRVAGDRVIVVGSGDPALLDPEMLAKSEARLTVQGVLRTLAGAVKRAGVGSVSEVIVDDRAFDRVARHPSWPARHLGEAYCPEVGGVNVHGNLMSLFVRPGASPGAPPTLTVEPSGSFIEVENQARTGTKEANTIGAERTGDGNRLRVRGVISAAPAGPIEVSMRDPARYFGMLLAEALVAEGVTVGGGAEGGARAWERARTAQADEVFEGAKTVAVVTTPIADVLKKCNTSSNNMYAEALLKAAGRAVTGEPGSFENGATVVRMMLSERVGPRASSSTTIADGSGLSELNRVSASTLTGWLVAMARVEAVSGVFIDSLAGIHEGSVRNRFRGHSLKNTLRAKTGHINGVSTLSGYLTDEATGRRVAFSVLTNFAGNNDRLSASMEFQREVVKAADAWLAREVSAESRVLKQGG